MAIKKKNLPDKLPPIDPEILNRQGKKSRPPKRLQEERIDEVVEMLLKCLPKSELYRFMKEKYNLDKRSVDPLVTKGYQIIKDSYEVDRDAMVSQHIQMYYQIANEAEFPEAKIKALQAIEKLKKLHTPEVAIQNNTIHLDLKDMNMNELRDLLKETD